MSRISSFTLTAAVAAGLSLAGGVQSASAAAIGLAFDNTAPPLLSPATVAGFVPQANWNIDAAGPTTLSNLTDDTGTPTGVSAQMSSLGSNNYYHFANNTATAGDTALYGNAWFSFGDHVAPDAWGLKVDLTGITYAVYDIYVYSEGSNGRSAEVNLDGTMTNAGGITGGISVNYTELGNQSSYIQATDGGAGNYVKFAGLSGSSHLLNIGAENSGGGLVGLQIVSAVPEPTTLALLGLGAISLLAKRRRQP